MIAYKNETTFISTSHSLIQCDKFLGWSQSTVSSTISCAVWVGGTILLTPLSIRAALANMGVCELMYELTVLSGCVRLPCDVA